MKKILVVDDASFMRMSIKTMLERNGYKVIGEAEDGAIAINKYKELQPNLVTLDITMPHMDGISALKEIIKIDPSANILMVSAMGQEALVKEAVIAGAKYFLVKPFKEDQLIKTVANILNN